MAWRREAAAWRGGAHQPVMVAYRGRSDEK